MIEPNQFRRTKIIATIGPASNNEATIEAMMVRGVNVFRLNFSHVREYGTPLATIGIIRALNKKLGLNTAIFGDLQGPKIRIGEIENGIDELVVGENLIFSTEPCVGNAKKVYLTYRDFPKDVKKGDVILMDDGKLKLEAISSNGTTEVVAKVISGGELKPKKGVNLPNTNVSMPSLTEKDRLDLDFIIEQDLDWVALSFVREAKDIDELKAIITKSGKDIKIIAKIEKPQAVEPHNLAAIIHATDVVMVARGDLGVEVEIEQLPILQKMIVRECRQNAKPVIVATQMLEGMEKGFMPTRAEVMDVSNAILDGADALMLSGETASGINPPNVIEMMHKIIVTVEQSLYEYNYKGIPTQQGDTMFVADSICYDATHLAQRISAKAIIAMTASGYTAQKISSYRPKAPIFVFTDNPKLIMRTSLTWGARAFLYDAFVSTDATVKDVIDELKAQNLLEVGDLVVNTGSMPIDLKGSTNMLKVSQVQSGDSARH